jgi:hypothetical protein
MPRARAFSSDPDIAALAQSEETGLAVLCAVSLFCAGPICARMQGFVGFIVHAIMTTIAG